MIFFPFQVQIFVGDTETFTHKDPLAIPFKTSESFKKVMQVIGKLAAKSGRDTVSQMIGLASLQSLYCDDFLSNAEVMKGAGNADLIVGDSMYICGSLIAAKFSLPFVTVFTNTLSAPTSYAYGLPLAPSYVPQFKSALSDQFSFVTRIQNVYQWILNYWAYYNGMVPYFQDLKYRYKIEPDKSLHVILNSVDLIIAQMGFFLDYPRPVLPSK